MGVGTDIVLCQLINMSVRSRWLQPGNWWVWVGTMVGPTPARGMYVQGGGVTRSDREHTDDGRVGRGQNANRLSRRFNKLNFNRN